MKEGKGRISTIAAQQKDMRGWLTGQFFPEDSPFHDPTVEIYCKVLHSDTFSDKLHTHPFGQEYLIVLTGRLSIRIGDEVLTIKTGDYIAMPAGVPDKIETFEEGTTIIGVRHPSIPNNKVLLE